ncbi:MAG TPA: hypothetical protein VJ771_04755 [Candidatus Nitrosotalea sp.]|nr:hypothetical protein [Candidatus Nitrosotalea sp.]
MIKIFTVLVAFLMLSVIPVGLIPIHPVFASTGQFALTVNAEDQNGNALTGYAIELDDNTGTLLDTGYSPAVFTLNAGQDYQVSPDDFGSCTFNHWADISSTDNPRTISITADTTITAVYDCGTGSGGGTGGSGSQDCNTQTEIASGFNGNSIAGGNYIWFNSNMKLKSSVPSDGLTIFFRNQTITGRDFTASVPDSEVIFSTSATSATTTFDTSSNMWVTTAPASFAGDVFLSGLAYQVPASGLPGGEKVTWSGTISSTSPMSIAWKWGAAVYTNFADYNSIGVKPVHSTSLDAYNNGDQAGTPENEKEFVIGGARGGGGSNWTGSWSATVTASSSCTTPSGPQVTLTVQTQLENGTALPGMFVELQNSAGVDIATGFSPVSFTVTSSQSYNVLVDNFDCYTFTSWQDTGSADNPRSISITSDTTLTALYTVNCGTGGGTGGGGGGTGGGSSSCGTQTSISSNFNGDSITGGNTIWFNSNMKLASAATDGLTLFFTGQTITSSDFTTSVPDSEVIFSASATSATTTFDTSSNMWVTTVPLGFSDDIFLSGLAYQVLGAGLSGGENPVTWSGNINSSSPVSLQWKWGAAVYTNFADYNSIGVKPVHSASLDAYNNDDQAGTPENEKEFVIGGARGGGGSNWTGSWSATVAASAAQCSPNSSGQVSLNVNAEDQNGNALTGYAIELDDNTGTLLDTGYSPAVFTLNAGQDYQVSPDDFGSCTFNHWSDTGSTSDNRDISIQTDTSLTAVFNCG